MSNNKIKVSEKEFWVLKNAIADRVYNLNSVIKRTGKGNEYWLKQVHLLESIRDRLKY